MGASAGDESRVVHHSHSALSLTINSVQRSLSAAAVSNDIDPTWLKPRERRHQKGVAKKAKDVLSKLR
jgi:hypothetical protein